MTEPWDYARLRDIAHLSSRGDSREAKIAIEALSIMRNKRYTQMLRLAENAINGNEMSMRMLDDMISSVDGRYVDILGF